MQKNKIHLDQLIILINKKTFKKIKLIIYFFFLFFAAKILLFYLIFYAALAGFFAGLLTIFWQTLEYDKPKYQLDNGIIGSNPG